jgi:hypothetical protein
VSEVGRSGGHGRLSSGKDCASFARRCPTSWPRPQTFSHNAWYASSLILPVTGGSSNERIEPVTDEIETLAKSDDGCRRVRPCRASARSSRVRWLQRSATARRSQEADGIIEETARRDTVIGPWPCVRWTIAAALPGPYRRQLGTPIPDCTSPAKANLIASGCAALQACVHDRADSDGYSMRGIAVELDKRTRHRFKKTPVAAAVGVLRCFNCTLSAVDCSTRASTTGSITFAGSLICSTSTGCFAGL